MWFFMWFCKNSGKQSRKKHFFKFWGPKLFLIEHCELKLYVWQCFWGISYYVSTIYAKSHEKSHRLWTQNQSLARGLLALQIKIPVGNGFLVPWEGGKWFYFFFLSLWLHPLATLITMMVNTWSIYDSWFMIYD